MISQRRTACQHHSAPGLARQLRHHPRFLLLREALAERGIGLRLAPARQAPQEDDRHRVSAWLENSRVVIGLPPATRPSEALRAGARVLAVLVGYPVPDEDHSLAHEVLIEAFAIDFALCHDERMALARSWRKRVYRRLPLSDQERAEAAAYGWAILCSLPQRQQSLLLEQINSLDFALGQRLQRLLGLSSALPPPEQAPGFVQHLVV